jgi:hypothetical protein
MIVLFAKLAKKRRPGVFGKLYRRAIRSNNHRNTIRRFLIMLRNFGSSVPQWLQVPALNNVCPLHKKSPVI